jgi:dephospho-CoA kinase
MRRKHLLLTGGIGAGKSEVGKLLARRGACVIDADRIGHQVLEPGGEAFEAVAAAFPDASADGVVDRRLLARDVFTDPVRLRLLESLTHPAIRQRIRELVEDCDVPLVVVEAPLLSDFMGDGWERVVVDAPDDARIRRLVDRGMAPLDAKARMAAQPSRDEWRALADFLIDNSGDLETLEAQVGRLWERLTADG